MVLLRLLSSSVGPHPGNLLVYLLLDSGGVELLDKTKSGLGKRSVMVLALGRFVPHAQQKRGRPFNDEGNKLEVLFDLSRHLSQHVRRGYADDLDVFAHRPRLSSNQDTHSEDQR